MGTVTAHEPPNQHPRETMLTVEPQPKPTTQRLQYSLIKEFILGIPNLISGIFFN